MKIKAGNKERPIKFGTYAIRELAHKQGKTFDEMLASIDKLDTEQTISLFYCGFVYGYRWEKEEVDFTEDDLWMWLDEDEGLMKRLMDIFIESYTKPGKGDSKKKQTQ